MDSTKARALIARWNQGLEWLKSPLLLAIRGYWGWQALISGWGKLNGIQGVADWFRDDLGIPFPLANAYAAATTEFVGGGLLLVGLATRIVSVPLAFTMVVAFLTSDRGALESLWLSEEACKASTTCTPFLEAAPLTFLVAFLVTLVFGPGAFSIDGLIDRFAPGRRVPE